jgi:hypothetical protein
MTVPPTAQTLRSYFPHVIYGALFLAVALIAAMTYLTAIGKPTDDLTKLLNTAANVVTLVLSGGGLVYAKKAQDTAGVAVAQTNGVLDDRIRAQIHQAMSERDLTRSAPADPSM